MLWYDTGTIMQEQKELQVFCDGGARGNPGPAAFGVYMRDTAGIEVFSVGTPIGHATNNTAEYKAVIAALYWLVEQDLDAYSAITFFLDSQLVCRQITGEYRTKHPDLQPLLFTILELQRKIAVPVHYAHIPREQNKKADALVNMALDKGRQVSYNRV